MPEEGSVYLDELTLPATYKLLRTRGLTNVTVLEVIKPGQRLWQWLLKKNGVYVVEATFFAGHLKTEQGEAVSISARRLSGQIALMAAREIVQSETHLQSLNKEYKRNTIRLFIAKQLHMHIEYWTVRALVAQMLCETGRATIWLKKPTLFNVGLLNEVLPGVNLRFYPTVGVGPIKLVMAWILDVARDIRLTLGIGQRSRCSGTAKTQKPSVLMLQEDNLRADRALRGQPHWLDVSKPIGMFDTYVVEFRGSKFSIAEDASQLSKDGMKILPTSAFRYAMQAKRKDTTLVRVGRDRRTAIRAVPDTRFANKFSCWAAALLRQAD